MIMLAVWIDCIEARRQSGQLLQIFLFHFRRLGPSRILIHFSKFCCQAYCPNRSVPKEDEKEKLGWSPVHPGMTLCLAELL